MYVKIIASVKTNKAGFKGLPLYVYLFLHFHSVV